MRVLEMDSFTILVKQLRWGLARFSRLRRIAWVGSCLRGMERACLTLTATLDDAFVSNQVSRPRPEFPEGPRRPTWEMPYATGEFHPGSPIRHSHAAPQPALRRGGRYHAGTWPRSHARRLQCRQRRPVTTSPIPGSGAHQHRLVCRARRRWQCVEAAAEQRLLLGHRAYLAQLRGGGSLP